MTNSKRTIGKLAAEAGVGVETIRYYERRGLLQQPPRHGTARNYGDEALWRLRYIKVGQRRDVIIVDGTWFIENARTPDGAVAPREEGVATLVAVKALGGWRVSAVREQTSATAIRDMQGP